MNTAEPRRDFERPRTGAYDGGALHATMRPTSRPTSRPARRYEIISELGGGAMSTVRLAHDTVSGGIVAIKSLAPDVAELRGARRRFAREAAILARLHHPNIVRMTAVEREGETPVAIVTEYVRGRSLRDVLADGRQLPVERVVRILRDVGAALAHAHAHRVVHCDVKPANILLDEEHDRAVLIDFGIACESGARPDSDDEELTVGSPAYMAPEQIEARAVDARTDVYALSIVAWELLAGRMPWLGEPLADVLHRQRFESLPDLALVRPDIPVYLLTAINGGLAKDPARRWRDGGELLRHLSPRALSIAATTHAAPALDATMRIDATSFVAPPVAETVAEAEVEPYGTAPRHRRRLLASTIAAAVLLALGSLAPRLSNATEHRAVAVDPELDSMLTLAVTPGATGASTASAAHGCFTGTRSLRTAHCAAADRDPASSRSGARSGARGDARRHHSSRRRAHASP